MNKQQLETIWEKPPADYYEKGKKRNIMQTLWHGEKWRVLQGLLDKDSRKILDLGCASGYITYKIHKALPEALVVGGDVSDKFIKFAKARYNGVTFVFADAHKLPFPNGSFDTIVCTETLEHVVKPKKVLSEIKRCLNKEGYLILSMDSGSFLFRLVWFFWTRFGPGRVWKDSHLHPFTSQSLETLIRSSGFRIKEKRNMFFGMAVFFKATPLHSPTN